MCYASPHFPSVLFKRKRNKQKWRYKDSWTSTSFLKLCWCCLIKSSPSSSKLSKKISLEKVAKFCYLGDTLDADQGSDSAVTASQICLEKVSWIPTHSNWKRILVKTEMQGICYLCDAWQWDLAYESWAWIEAESHWNKYDQMDVWG